MDDNSNIMARALEEARKGQLMRVLRALPRARWTLRDRAGSTLLHYAAIGRNSEASIALLNSGLIDVNSTNIQGSTPAHFAAGTHGAHSALELLCAAGANLRARTIYERTPLDLARCSLGASENVCVLIANGCRLGHCTSFVADSTLAFERRVLRRRTAVVALLRVKKVGQLWRWDKFLLRELAFAVWATRQN